MAINFGPYQIYNRSIGPECKTYCVDCKWHAWLVLGKRSDSNTSQEIQKNINNRTPNKTRKLFCLSIKVRLLDNGYACQKTIVFYFCHYQVVTIFNIGYISVYTDNLGLMKYLSLHINRQTLEQEAPFFKTIIINT